MRLSWLFFCLLLALTLIGAGCVMPVNSSNRQTWREPLERAAERDKKLTFGLYVTPDPEQNPIDPPERFTGYHTALDFEIFEDELEKSVPVFAACEGKIVYKKEVEGYGGTLVQTCLWEGRTVTVLYGHLDIDSISLNVGERVGPADILGELGDHKSAETSLTRKHLHFGVHKGADVVLLGYVQTEEELVEYLDPEVIFGYK